MTGGLASVPEHEELRQRAAEVTARTIALAGVPAPSGRESQRAEMVAAWFEKDGFERVWSDELGNCWALARPGSGPAIVLAAHLDTVFGFDIEHGARREGDKLFGPSVGDDSVAVAALPALGSMLAETKGSAPVFVVATVGEEGLGNLAGARHAVANPPSPLAAFIAIEGNYLGRVATTGVGSCRFRVTVSTPGGHAWEQSAAPSAVHEAAAIVTALSRLETRPGETSLNVGRFTGGEAINARARSATFDLELRGADARALDMLESSAKALVYACRAATVGVEAEDLGRRPGGRLSPGHPLLEAVRSAHSAHGWPCHEIGASTDANAALAAGIPALALGITTGSGEHTPAEWIDLPPIADGLGIVLASVLGFEHTLDARGPTAPEDEVIR
jgi:tripeptide aminopeptidase